MTGDDEVPPSDLRFTQHARRDIKIERDLSGSGHLTRGDHTNMSRLRFTAHARPADPGERDQTFVDRDQASPTTDPPASSSPATAEPQSDDQHGLLGRLGRLFGK